MLDRDKIRKLVEGCDLSLIGDPLPDPDVDSGVIVFVKAKENSVPSLSSRVARLQRELKNEGVFCKIIVPSQGDERIEGFLAASLKASFPDLEPSLILSSGLDGSVIWVSFPAEIDGLIKDNVEGSIQRFLTQLGIENAIVKFNAEKNYPSPTACLRVLRRYAPCSAGELARRLHLPGFDQMSLGEVQRFLDTTRRKGLAVRREDGKYILTLKCLMELGSSRDRFSPDVSRALALRRLGA